MHDGAEVVWKVQSVASLHLEVPFVAFKTKTIYTYMLRMRQ